MFIKYLGTPWSVEGVKTDNALALLQLQAGKSVVSHAHRHIVDTIGVVAAKGEIQDVSQRETQGGGRADGIATEQLD